jgi:hypothetical protein
METGQLLAKPDQSFVEILKDARVWSSAIGALAENALERAAFMARREDFGYATEKGGSVVFTDAKGVANSKYALNRHLFRLAAIATCVYGITWAAKAKNGELQYGLFGAAVTAAAHTVQDLFPVLAVPARK